jgi:hypothetical protein
MFLEARLVVDLNESIDVSGTKTGGLNTRS